MYVNNGDNNNLRNSLNEIFSDIVFSADGMILSYTSSEREYDLLNHGAGITVDAVAVHRITGKDCKDYLHRISSNDINSVEDDSYISTLFLNDKGRIIDRTSLLNFGSDYLLVSNFEYREKLRNWIERYIIMEDITVEDVSDQYLLAKVYGPQAESFITLLYGDKKKEFEKKGIVIDTIQGIDSILIKDCVNSIDIFSILIHPNSLTHFYKFIRESHSVFDVCFAGYDAFETFRVERGIPLCPNEINDDFNPYDVNLIGDISFTKGCYIGQEVIARLDTYPAGRREFKGFCLKGGCTEFPIELLDANKEYAGIITSCVHSKILNEWIGIGPVKQKILNNGSDDNLYAGEIPVKLENLPIKL